MLIGFTRMAGRPAAADKPGQAVGTTGQLDERNALHATPRTRWTDGLRR